MSESNSDNGEPAAKKIKLEPNQEPIQEETLEMKDGKPWNGKGVSTYHACYYSNGVYHKDSYDSYDGYFENGKRHGKGKITYAKGDIYDGEWENDKRHGKGKYTEKYSGIYEGEWENDKKHGKGKYIETDGSIYEGHWVNGKRHGEGKQKYSNDDIYQGEWRNGYEYNGRRYKLEYISIEGKNYKPC